jgi:RsiW-degrading membrane proteinase PrsW (M82 family)
LWIVASIGPPLLLIGYGLFKARDSWSAPALWVALGAGIGAAGVAAPLEALIEAKLGLSSVTASDDALRAGMFGFLVAAGPEEVLKMLGMLFAMVVLDARRLRSVLMVAIAVAMGFAGIENTLYLLRAGSDWQAVALLRGAASVPIHGVCGLMMGAVVVGTIANDINRWVGLLLALLVPIALHGTFDTLLMLSGPHVLAFKMPAVVLAMLGGGVLAVALCNAALVAAARADGEQDLGGPLGGKMRVLVKRAARVHLGLVLIPVILGRFQPEAMWNASLLAVLPAVLTFDVLFSRPKRRPLSDDKEWIRVEHA